MDTFIHYDKKECDDVLDFDCYNIVNVATENRSIGTLRYCRYIL